MSENTTTTNDEALDKKLASKGYPENDIKTFLAYIQGEKDKEKNKEQNKRPVTNNSDAELYTMFAKFHRLGLVIDGINVVITGKAMAMVTFHGYKNKVKQSYPSAKFDVQLVREGDEFKVSKKDGQVTYSHEIANAFSSGDITGAYCVIKIDDQHFFEGLNQKDFEEMANASKQSWLWKKWASEFWLKSVMKRACKRHFYDEVEELDKVDNDDYGLAEGNDKPQENEDQIERALDLIKGATDEDDLKTIWMDLGSLISDQRLMDAKNLRKMEILRSEKKVDEVNEDAPDETN